MSVIHTCVYAVTTLWSWLVYCMHVMVTLAARGVLYTLGWSLPPQQAYALHKKYPRLVLLFSHSSYWDFVMCLLYMVAVPDLWSNLYTIAKPQPFEYAGWLLTRAGFVPAPKLDERQGGGVATILRHLQHKTTIHLMLSPKGTIVMAPWRSGYYWLARDLQANITVMGLDYRLKRPVFGQVYDGTLPKDQLQPLLQADMAKIAPLYSWQELSPLASSTGLKVVDWHICAPVCMWLLLSCVCAVSWPAVFVSTVVMVWCLHQAKELLRPQCA